MRVIEIYKATGKTKTEQEIESRKNEVPYNYIVFAINMDREKLYDRINRRVNIMLEEGLIEEVELLLKKYKEFPTAMQGLGYKEVIEYINDNELIKAEDKIWEGLGFVLQWAKYGLNAKSKEEENNEIAE